MAEENVQVQVEKGAGGVALTITGGFEMVSISLWITISSRLIADYVLLFQDEDAILHDKSTQEEVPSLQFPSFDFSGRLFG